MVDSMLQVLSVVPRENATPIFWVGHPGIVNYRAQIQVTLKRQCCEAMGIRSWGQRIFALDISMARVSDDQKQTIEQILKSIAINREKLKIGKYSEPPMDRIEEILIPHEFN